MTRVLFVCTANQCRSPMAERLLRRRLPAVTVGSAGLSAAGGHPMVAESAAALRKLGGDDAGFSSRALTQETLDDVDLVLTMTAAQRAEVLSRFPRLLHRTFTLAEAAALADVAEADVAEADVAEADVAEADVAEATPGGDVAEALAAARARTAGRPAEYADVPDPVGLPAGVHEQVAAQIAGYLDALLPLLSR